MILNTLIGPVWMKLIRNSGFNGKNVCAKFGQGRLPPLSKDSLNDKTVAEKWGESVLRRKISFKFVPSIFSHNIWVSPLGNFTTHPESFSWNCVGRKSKMPAEGIKRAAPCSYTHTKILSPLKSYNSASYLRHVSVPDASVSFHSMRLEVMQEEVSKESTVYDEEKSQRTGTRNNFGWYRSDRKISSVFLI